MNSIIIDADVPLMQHQENKRLNGEVPSSSRGQSSSRTGSGRKGGADADDSSKKNFSRVFYFDYKLFNIKIYNFI